MAVPDWKQIRDELRSGQMTHKQYSKLYLNSFPEKLPEWLIQAFRPYSEEVRRAHRIEVSRNETQDVTAIVAHCWDGRSYVVNVSDETPFGPRAASLVTPTPLPVVRSPYPILGWRQWGRRETLTTNKVGMFGLYGQRWETPLMRARCGKGHTAPAEGCRCGIYLTKERMFSWHEDDSAGIVVATDVIEHERGYRAGLVRCIAISNVHPDAHGWDGITIMTDTELISYAEALIENPSLIPYPDDLPAP